MDNSQKSEKWFANKRLKTNPSSLLVMLLLTCALLLGPSLDRCCQFAVAKSDQNFYSQTDWKSGIKLNLVFVSIENLTYLIVLSSVVLLSFG